MEFLNILATYIQSLDVMPGLVGAVAGLYVQADEYQKLTYGRAALVFLSSLAVSHFIGNFLCGYWSLDGNGSSALKFAISTYTPDIMQASDKVVAHFKENPMSILQRFTKAKSTSNEKDVPDAKID